MHSQISCTRSFLHSVIYNLLTKMQTSGGSFCRHLIRSASGSYIKLSDVVKGPQATTTRIPPENMKQVPDDSLQNPQVLAHASCRNSTTKGKDFLWTFCVNVKTMFRVCARNFKTCVLGHTPFAKTVSQPKSVSQ